MDHQQRSLRIGAAVILCALLTRLAGSGFFQPLVNFLAQPKISSFLVYLETGRVVRFSTSLENVEVFALESPAPDFVADISPQETAAPVFTAADLELFGITYNSSARPDLEALITRELSWDLTGTAPTVLILHTHTTESYTKADGEDYEESSAYRTLDEGYNMLSIGDHLASLLEVGGISVLHDRELHDYPSYNGSYNHARASIEEYLAQYPSIRLVLDLHRDAAGTTKQLRTYATVNGQPSAQLMLVMGSNTSGLKHPNWEQNLALGLKLQAQLEKEAPGITRDLNLRSQRFNQDLCAGALLVEVGAAGNSRAEALTAVEVLARAVLTLANGANAGTGEA